MNRRKTWLGVLCIVAASVIWGATGLVVRRLNAAGFSNLDVLETRAVLGAVFTGIYLAVWHREDLRIRLRDSWCFVGTGILNLMLCGICNFYCIKNTSLAIAGAMIQTGPAFAMIFGWLIFKERMTARKLIAMALTFSGCVMASGLSGGERLTPVGFLLGIGSGIGYAMYSVFGRAAINRGYRSTTITFYSFICCAVGCAAFADWGGMVSSVQATPSALFWVVFVGLANGFGGYVLYTKGLENIETGKASILCSLELVTNVLIGLLVYGEYLSLPVGVGLVLIFTGILVSGLRTREETTR